MGNNNGSDFGFDHSFRIRGHQRLFGAFGLALAVGGLALVAWVTDATPEQVQQWVALLVTGGAAGFGLGKNHESRQARTPQLVSRDEGRGGEPPASEERAQPSTGDATTDRPPEG